MFRDRDDAAAQLANKLKQYKNSNAVVLAIPRGGVPVGFVIANELGLPLEIILSKKIGHPYNPEYAIGSVSLQGTIINDDIIDVSMEYIHKEEIHLKDLLKKRYKLYMGDKKPIDLKNKIVIIVDDGIATGTTLLAAIASVKKSGPEKIVVAVPVVPSDNIKKFASMVDEFIYLDAPEIFMAVGQFYKNFRQVSDTEVIRYLDSAHNKIQPNTSQLKL